MKSNYNDRFLTIKTSRDKSKENTFDEKIKLN